MKERCASVIKTHKHINHNSVSECVLFPDNSRPLLISEHSLNAPARAEYVEGLGETVIVYQAGVNGEKPHHQDDVTSAEERRPYLGPTETRLSA